ncbi:unnamed protein product [Meloidogyne enterolobii]|uniref:Uncharacterized protein n=1 Tax=Meloidogyne enterolobii TaxID=390850 RepID=A0ACB0ZZE0_MELEN
MAHIAPPDEFLAPEHTSSQRHNFLQWHQQQHFLHSSLGTIKTTFKYQQINNFNFKNFYLLH